MRPLLPTLALFVLLGGCSVGSGDGSSGEDSSDKRALALECLEQDKGLGARLDGDDALIVGDPERGPRIRFYLTSGEAEAAQFEGKGEGAEQIGSALLFVRDGSDEVLEQVEDCLGEL
jgi:hypothetical protein